MPPTASASPGTGQRGSALERRLCAEWQILCALRERNPDRLTGLSAHDLTFFVTLRGTPALTLAGGPTEREQLQTEHALRLEFPRFFPAAPMELYLHEPMQHPNIHPETGFVCLWDRHCISHTVEHALLKTAAILGWRLSNRNAIHVMQSAALARLETSGESVAAWLAAPPLLGLVPPEQAMPLDLSTERRRRLS